MSHNVTVASADKKVIIATGDEIKEGFILIGHGMKDLPCKGDKGKVVFESGGIKGGYWQYYPNRK